MKKNYITVSQNLKKKLPQGDGYTEFFEPNIWLKLNKDNFLPISDSTLRKINNKKQKIINKIKHH